MKKTALLSLLVAGSLVACNKDDKKSNTVPVSQPISTDNVQTLSDSLKVNHFKTSTKDSLPLAKGGTIVLDNNTDTVFAVNGGFAIVLPNFDDGTTVTPAGYYIKVKGANTYYTLDFSQPLTRKKAVHHGQGRVQISPDSIIAIKLPITVLSGTFTLEYEAYDANGNVSNKATSIVKVMANDQTNADFKLLLGAWTWGDGGYVSGKDTPGIYTNPVIGVDSTIRTYSCNEDGTLSESETGTQYNISYTNTTANNIIFNGNNTATENYVSIRKSLDLDNSRCGAPVYEDNSETDHDVMSFAYNPSTKQLYIIYDNGGVSSNDYGYYVESYYNVTITGNKLYLEEKGEADDHGFYYLTK